MVASTNQLIPLATPVGDSYSGPGVTNNVFNPTLLLDGRYTITYTYVESVTSCQNSCEFIITVYIGINEIVKEGISVYPNPNNGKFTINLKDIKDAKKYQIYDIKGSLIVEQIVTDELQEVNMNVQSGYYTIKVITDTNVYIERIVVN